MRSALVTFAVTGTTGSNITQTVPGVSDANGPFTGEIFIPQHCFAAINTVTAGAVGVGSYCDFRGLDLLTKRSLWASSESYSGFNFKACDTGQSLGDHSIMEIWSDNFGQGQIYRTAKISASRLGEFDVFYSSNLRSGDVIQMVVLADVSVEFTNYINGTYVTASKPQGFLCTSNPSPAASGGTSWGTGGQDVGFGFATRDGAYGCSNLFVVNQGSNFGAQHTDGFANNIDGFGNQTAVRNTVSAWNPLSFTIANGNAVTLPMVFCGDNIRTAGGAITQGDSSFNTLINPKIVFFISYGYVAGSAVQTPICQMARGWAVPNGATQIGYWGGEVTTGNIGFAKGARYLSNNSVIRFGTPNAGSTTFDAIGNVVNISTSGLVTMNWSVDDLIDRQVLWFAVGEEAVPDSINRGKGIYKLIPDKRQDTIWFDVLTNSTYLAKKPNPSIDSFYAGDE